MDGAAIVMTDTWTQGHMDSCYMSMGKGTVALKMSVPTRHCYSRQHGIFLISLVQGAILLRFHRYSIFPRLEDTLCPGPSVFVLFLPPLLGCSLSPGCRDGIVGGFIGPGYPEITYFLHFNQLWVSEITSISGKKRSFFGEG